MWQIHYQGVSRANTVIDIVPEIKMDETIKNRLIGEARFLRALFYFNLVRFYGDVPLLTSLKTSLTDAMGPRTPKDQVYKQIIDDLTFAENNLPNTYAAADVGRATKGAAKILLGKVYLTMQNFQSCVTKLAEVLESEAAYGYGLHENYKDNWEKATENGKESVLTIEYMESPGVGNGMMEMQGPKYSIPGGFQAIGINNANEADIPTRDLYSQFLDEDTRKSETMRTEFFHVTTGAKVVSSIPLFVKYWEDGEKIVGNCDVNFHILRYADALLMYAEALNETGQSAKAHDILNRVRTRAFKSASYNFIGLSQADFRTAVWQERRLELAMEGHRWFDLVRTGRLVQRMKDHAAYEASVAESNKVQIAQNVKDHMVLMPIPQRELDLNPNLVQNPGW
jgi:tetratricopeptide (TPR) repeat protein